MDKATQDEWIATLNQALAGGGYEVHHLKYSEEMLYGTHSWNEVPSQAEHQVWTLGVCEQGSGATAIRFRVCDVAESNHKRITKDWPFSTLLKRAEDFVEAGAPLRVVMSLREEERREEEAAQEKKAALAERTHKIRLGYVWEHLSQFVWDIGRVDTSVRLEALPRRMSREPEDALAEKRYVEANDALHTFLGFSYHDSFQVDEDTSVQVNDGRISLLFASRMSFEEHKGKLHLEPKTLEKQYRAREEELSEAIRARDNALSILEETRRLS